ncbi:hypothetical protein Lalb_Chr14g0364601 [Lupinus albus]|uniref:Uncharacterized protein n=1 Tax=Lupinus albus TaxID=3870 RepID=A0A6A4P1B4_LUPAL|nr:hypothetical protein Lalb_Chr14g0364601 [Lupinus albus]
MDIDYSSERRILKLIVGFPRLEIHAGTQKINVCLIFINFSNKIIQINDGLYVKCI